MIPRVGLSWTASWKKARGLRGKRTVAYRDLNGKRSEGDVKKDQVLGAGWGKGARGGTRSERQFAFREERGKFHERKGFGTKGIGEKPRGGNNSYCLRKTK